MRNYAILITIIISFVSCRNYEENVDVKELRTLAPGFYAYRRGSLYTNDIELKKYMIWFHLNKDGNVGKIFRIDNLQNYKDTVDVVSKFKLDTIAIRNNMEKFLLLSKKYGFGHVYIDPENKIYFSRIEDLSEQYVMPFNVSVEKKYSNNKDFELENNWFVNKHEK